MESTMIPIPVILKRKSLLISLYTILKFTDGSETLIRNGKVENTTKLDSMEQDMDTKFLKFQMKVNKFQIFLTKKFSNNSLILSSRIINYLLQLLLFLVLMTSLQVIQ